MFDALQAHALGEPIPNTPHAVSCSLPTMEAIVAYEKKEPQTLARLKAGYPRFVRHPFIARFLAEIAQTHNLQDRTLFALRSDKPLSWIQDFLSLQQERREVHRKKNGKKEEGQESHAGTAVPDASLSVLANSLEGFWVDDCFILHTKAGQPDVEEAIQKFLQHTGASISSRQAEDALQKRGLLFAPVYAESYAEPSRALSQIKDILTEKHNAKSIEDIYIGNSGMSCFYAAFRALQEIQAKNGRHIWIQLGWLYLDTIEILKKYEMVSGGYVYFHNVFDLDLLRGFIESHGSKIAGIVTESPTNPLVETPDIVALQKLACENGIALVLDPTIVSPHNIHCLEYADVIVNSLTKYAANEGDVMMGSLALNAQSPFYPELKRKIPLYLIEPYKRDVERLAFEIQNYDAVIFRINENHNVLLQMLKKHPKVSKVHHALCRESRRNYEKIQKENGGSGCMLSIEINGSMEKFYDSINIAKGPSFGMKYSLLCPFIYLAHFDLVQNKQGQKKLWESGLDPKLIRISVGCEDPDRLCAVFDDALCMA